MSYPGPERRIHRVFVTHNSEYHTRQGVCVAVRRLSAEDLTREHPAVGGSVLGGIGYDEERGYLAHFGIPDEGEKICFSNDVITSPILAVQRPSRDVVAGYSA
ncbi:MAG: hypothetical protein AAFQ65_02625 [Myxococcota bacterium]